jgi:hypothetical protein
MSDKYKTEEGKLYYATVTVVGWIDVFTRKEWMMHMFKYYGKGNSQNMEYQFWQNGNHPIELWRDKVIRQKMNYLHNNPVKQGIVSRPEDYLYSSANPLSIIKVLPL